MKEIKYKKPNFLIYDLVSFLYKVDEVLHMKHSYVRNEIKNIKGPAVLLGTHVSSHEHGIDAHSLKKRMNYVVAESTFYPVHNKMMRAIGVIPKQQFYSGILEFRLMRDVIKNNGILCLYPAGLCTADGKNTPLPSATAKLLKNLDADVYVAKHNGFYLYHPKWTKNKFKGKTETDIYKLFTKEDLEILPLEEISKKLESAMEYNEYLWQEKHHYKYKGIEKLDGLENVLYDCPKCHSHYSIECIDHKLVCLDCGYTKKMDFYGFFNTSKEDNLKYTTQWHEIIIENIKNQISNNPEFKFDSNVDIEVLNKEKNRFDKLGKGVVSINLSNITIFVDNSEIYSESVKNFWALPMIPGSYFDLQDGKTIYRCYPTNPKDVSYITDIVIAEYEQRQK